jgi:hypothetical protein
MLEMGRVRITRLISPTDSLHFTMQAKGMTSRMGTASKPSWALSYVHVAYINTALDTAFLLSNEQDVRHELAVAAYVNLGAYPGWLRGGEIFDLKREDAAVIPSSDGPTVGLPSGLGVVTGTLLEERISDPIRTADVVIAYWCLLSLGLGI